MSKKIFARLGVVMTLTEAEFSQLSSGGVPAAQLVKALVDRGRFTLDGETYFPKNIHPADDEYFHEEEFTFEL